MNHKAVIFVLTSLFILLPNISRASYPYHIPNTPELEIQLNNASTKNTARIYLVENSKNSQSELEQKQELQWNLQPAEKLILTQSTLSQFSWLQFITTTAETEIWVRLKNSKNKIKWPNELSNILTIPHRPEHSTLWVTNTNEIPQDIQIIGLRSDGNAPVIYSTIHLAENETRTIDFRDITFTKDTTDLVLKGEYKLTALYFDQISKILTAAKSVHSSSSQEFMNSHPEGKVFTLANPDRTQSFQVLLTDPELIAQARKQIQEPNSFTPRLLVAEIKETHDKINFNKVSANQAPWSWHVNQVFRFADFGSIDCDGNPVLVETNLKWWLQAKGGLICFWNYKVISEEP